MTSQLQDLRLPFERAAHRHLGLDDYFAEIDRALHRVVPSDAACFLTLDPATLLPTSHRSPNYPSSVLMAIVANEYLGGDVNAITELARAPRPAALMSTATGGRLDRSPRYEEILLPLGFAGDELRAVFREGDAVWGVVAMHRRRGGFDEAEADLVASLSPMIATGIRRAILRTAQQAGLGPQPPGLIVVAADNAVDQITPAAATLVAEIIDSTAKVDGLPLAVASVANLARRAVRGETGEVAAVRLPTRSGGWLRLDASVLDEATDRVAIIISVAREPEIATLITQAYGLSAREREVTALVLRGASTREIAAALHVTPYTVQDHLKSIFERVGVHSRRALVAQLFYQQCAPRLGAGTLPGPDGWFAADAPDGLEVAASRN